MRTTHLKKIKQRAKSQLTCRLGKTPTGILLHPHVQDLNTPQNSVMGTTSCYLVHLCTHSCRM